MLPLPVNVGAAVRADAGEVLVGIRLEVYEPSALVATTEMVGCPVAVSALGYCGAQAQIRYWWFRNEPPKAAWKKLSANTYFCANLYNAVDEPSKWPITSPPESAQAANWSFLPP